jgi:hypothetical protein
LLKAGNPFFFSLLCVVTFAVVLRLRQILRVSVRIRRTCRIVTDKNIQLKTLLPPLVRLRGLIVGGA